MNPPTPMSKFEMPAGLAQVLFRQYNTLIEDAAVSQGQTPGITVPSTLLSS